MTSQIIFRANLYIYNGKSEQVRVISNKYRVKSDLYRHIYRVHMDSEHIKKKQTDLSVYIIIIFRLIHIHVKVSDSSLLHVS